MSNMISTICFFSLTLTVFRIADGNMATTGPFKRVLEIGMKGEDVVILTNLLQRVGVTGYHKPTISSMYDEDTKRAVEEFQEIYHMTVTGVLDRGTADLVLQVLLSDGYVGDTNLQDFKFKFLIPVYKDRNVETTGFLYDGNGIQRYAFRVRAHGALDRDTAINQLTTNGNTPTGLITADLNSPEPYPKLFGPYPVIRCVKGLKGNAAIGINDDTLLSNYRSGILIHTGQWDNWDPSKNMPNSKGCMHVHPTDMKNMVNILRKELGVTVNKNPFGKVPYPFETQGYVSIVQID